MKKKTPIPSINVPIMVNNGSMELAWYLYLKWLAEGGETTVSVEVDSTETGQPGTDAEVTNVGDDVDVRLKFKIPRGQTGATGPTGPQGPQGEQGIQGEQGVQGPQGNTGPYFTPAVDASGNISWTNNGGLPNPQSQNIKGPQGAQGIQGIQGPQGETGPQGPQGEQGEKYGVLFDAKPTDHILNDISWLRADTFSWQPGIVYTRAYQHLVADFNSLPTIPTITIGADVYTRYTDGDVSGALHPYCWRYNNTNAFTNSETPSVGDWTYGTANSTIENLAVDAVGTGTPTPETETIEGVTITYYTAPDGHKICLPDQHDNVLSVFNLTGDAWYYILDTTNQRFKLPRRRSRKVIRAGTVNGNWYRLYADGWVEQGGPILNQQTYTLPITMRDTTYFCVVSWDGGKSSAFYPSDFRVRDFTTTTFYTTASRNGSNVQGTRWEVCGYSAIDTSGLQGNEKYMYFYVGDWTESAAQQTAGLNAELFNQKADISAVPDIITPDYDNWTQKATNTTHYADKNYIAILGRGAGAEAQLLISRSSDMSSPKCIAETYITSSGNIYFTAQAIIPKGWYYRFNNYNTCYVVAIG